MIRNYLKQINKLADEEDENLKKQSFSKEDYQRLKIYKENIDKLKIVEGVDKIVGEEISMMFKKMKRAILKSCKILNKFIQDMKRQNTEGIEKNIIFI